MTTGADDFASVRFATADLPERERIARFREEIGRTLVHVDIEQLDGQPLDVTWTVSGGDGLGLMASDNSAVRMDRSAAMAALDGDGFTLSLNLGGSGLLQQRGREVTLGAGEAVLMAHAEPATFVHSGGRQIAMAVPRAALTSLMADIEDLAAFVIRDSEALRLLQVYLGAVFGETSVQTPELRQLAVTHVHDLMALAIGATREGAELAQARGVRAARTREIISQIKSGFAEPSFSANTVAAKLRLSPRYVQDLLQDTGENFTERVLEMRLQKARRMLALSANDRLTVGEVAYACGFNEVSYFNRCFRRRFGAPPSHFRGKGAEF